MTPADWKSPHEGMRHGDAERIKKVRSELGLGEAQPWDYLFDEWEQKSMDEQFEQIADGEDDEPLGLGKPPGVSTP